MKVLGIVGIVVAGLTIYWVVTSKSQYLKSLPAAALPPAGGSAASTVPIAGTQGGTAASGPAPNSSLFNQLFPQIGAVSHDRLQ
jgi:hypothetical protein